MANGFLSVAGLAAATLLGRKTQQQDLARRNKMRATYGLEPIADQKAPIDKAINWVGDKFKSASKAGAATSVTAPEAGDTEDVGLWERLKAGNIDEVGSEAYSRFGQGKVDGDAAQTQREMRRTSPDKRDDLAELDERTREAATMTTEQWNAAPDMDGFAADKLAALDELPLL